MMMRFFSEHGFFRSVPSMTDCGVRSASKRTIFTSSRPAGVLQPVSIRLVLQKLRGSSATYVGGDKGTEGVASSPPMKQSWM